MKTLADWHKQENNFNSIRLIAALFVLFSHSFPLSGNNDLEPLYQLCHITFGNIAVLIFFLISGYLITDSYLRRDDFIAFMKARIYRIFPGLIIAVLFASLIIGALLTTLPIMQYLTNYGTWKFIAHNSFLYNLQWNLPGVFSNNFYKDSVNGSLWTLPTEFNLYLMTGCLGLAGILNNKNVANFILLLFLILINIKLYNSEAHRPILFYLLGMFTALNKDSKTLSRYLFKPIFYIAYQPYLRLRFLSKYCDLSYGIYIYAFPIQQAIVQCLGINNPYKLFIFALIPTFICAMFSWFFIEKPFIKNRKISKSNNFIYDFRPKLF